MKKAACRTGMRLIANALRLRNAKLWTKNFAGMVTAKSKPAKNQKQAARRINFSRAFYFLNLPRVSQNW
jgi:hypothetical protein